MINLTKENLLKLGMQSISVISEGSLTSFNPRILFKYLNGEEDIIDVKKNENVDNKIDNKINEIRKKIAMKERKEKLNKLK